MTESTPWGDAPVGFCACPPACLVLLEDREARGVEKARKAFIDEARELQRRLMEELLQVNTEVGVFLRLMYKNKNQHRRSLYYRRLSEVKRDLQMLGTSGLQETVEAFTMLCTAARTDRPPSKATPQSKLIKDEINERTALCNLLGVARLLNQIDGPILAASVHIAGLLAQSFFVPFALTIFSSLARFRVLLAQVLYDVITAFNLLSAILELRCPGSIGVLWRGLPDQLECTWDGIKLCITEKKPSTNTVIKGKQSDGLAEPAALWFVDDRTGATYDLPVTANSGFTGQKQHVNSGKPINANRDNNIGQEMEKVASTVPVLEETPSKGCQFGVTGEFGESLPSSLDVNLQEKDLNRASDLPFMAPQACSGMGETFKSKAWPIPGLESTAENSNTRLSSSLRGVPTRGSVLYTSISKNFVADCAIKGRMSQSVLPKNANVGGMVKDEVQMPELEKNKDIASEVDPSRRKNFQSGSLLDVNVFEDRAGSMASILPPLPLSVRSTKKTESDTSKDDLGDLKGMEDRNASIPQALLEGQVVKLVHLDEHDKAKQVIARHDSAGKGMSTVDAVMTFETMSKYESLEVAAQLSVGEDSICVIQRASDELRTTLDSNTCSLDRPIEKQDQGTTITLQKDGTESGKSTAMEKSKLEQGTIQSSLPVAVDEVCGNNLLQNGSGHTAQIKKPESGHVHSLGTTSGGYTEADHNVVGKVELEAGAHQCIENAKEKQRIEDGPVTPDHSLPIVNRSIVSSLELAEDIEARPVSSGVRTSGDILHQAVGLSTVNGMIVKGPLLKRPVAYTSINPGLISGRGASDMTVFKDDCDGGLKHMRNVPKKVLEHAAKQNLGKHARAAMPTKSKKSKGGVHVMLPSIDPDVKTPKRRKEADSRPAMIKEKVVSKGWQQSTEITDTPAKSNRQRGEDEKEEKVKKKKVDDIFAMLLGGSR